MAKMRSHTIDGDGDVNIRCAETVTPIHHKNDNKLDPPAAIYLHLACLAVNHLGVNQGNPDPLLFLYCLFDVVDSDVGERRFFAAL